MPVTPMLARHVAVILVLAGIAFSGCLGETKDPQPTPTTTATNTGAPSSTTVSPPPPPLQNETRPLIAWNHCRGFASTVFFYANVVDLDDGQTPPGWEPTLTQDDRYLLAVNTCERVSIGPYERGPVSFFLELHTAVNPPEACNQFEAGFDDMSILLGMWVSDQEVAAHLAQTYQMPVRYGQVSVTETPTADGMTYQWTVSSDGGESNLVVYRPGGDEDLSPRINRLVWHNGTGVTFWDYHDEPVIPYATAPPTTGTIAPPMKYAQGTTRPFSGLGEAWSVGDFYGPLYRFGDMACKDLLG
ncbi:MAG: hypothetical protein ACYC2H_00060 [Thermoplasmatota archaeon]